MVEITVSAPAVGQEAYFKFKNPVLTYVQSKLNTNEASILLKVIGINNLRGLLEAELRDPYVDTYAPMGIGVQDYRDDVLNDIPLYVFSYRDMGGNIVYLKAPLNYIQEYSGTLDINYTNRLIVLEMGKLPATLDTVVIFQELQDLVYDKLGVTPTAKEISIGEPEKIERADHELRESIRKQSIQVAKSTKAALAEITHKYNELTARLSDMGIVLG